MAKSMEMRIRRRLEETLKPLALEITDDSARHEGHAGSRPGGGTHFMVKIVSPAFAGLGLLARHRLVYAALGAEMKDPIHALVIKALAPDEIQL